MKTATLALLLPIAGCALPAPTYEYGTPLNDLELNLFALDMGIYPSTSVLDDPNNPFAETGVPGDLKWDINSDAGPVAAFYSWATVLTGEPTGENQYYTALSLTAIWSGDLVPPEELVYVRDMAIDAHMSVLENFPESVTYDATGTIPYDLAPLSYQAILDLGGTPLEY